MYICQIQHFRWTIVDKRLGIKLSGTTLPWNIYTGLTRQRNTDLPKSGLHLDIKAHCHIRNAVTSRIYGAQNRQLPLPRHSDYSTCAQQSSSPRLAFRCLSTNSPAMTKVVFISACGVCAGCFFPREKKCIWCTISLQPSLLVIIRNPLQRILRRHRSSRRKGSEQAVALVNTCLEPWPFR